MGFAGKPHVVPLSPSEEHLHEMRAARESLVQRSSHVRLALMRTKGQCSHLSGRLK